MMRTKDRATKGVNRVLFMPVRGHMKAISTILHVVYVTTRLFMVTRIISAKVLGLL